MRDLLQFWSRRAPTAPYAHPADLPALLARQGEIARYGIALDLLPQPWVGPILRAKAFVLQLNPGLSGSEHEIEREDRDFRDALVRNLNGQEPNIFLDPRFTRHPGRAWVEQRLRGVASLPVLCQSLAQLELFPYHSKSFSAAPARLRRALLELPSVHAIRRAVHEDLLPRAARGEITIVVMRSAREWGLRDMSEHSDLVVYRGGEPRAGYCTPRTRGGRALLARLASPPACKT